MNSTINNFFTIYNRAYYEYDNSQSAKNKRGFSD